MWQRLGVACLLVCVGSGVGAQPSAKPDWRKAIMNMAADPKYVDYKIQIGSTREGSTWWIKVRELAKAYKSGLPTPGGGSSRSIS